MSTEIQRTPREEFRERYGEGLAQGYDFPRPPYSEPAPEVDDMSELYYKVMRYREAMGFPDDDFMRRLRDAEEIMDEALDIVAAFEPEQSYDEALDEYDDEQDWTRGRW